MTRLLLAVVLLAAFATGAAADKTLTYLTAVLADVDELCFARSETAPNGWRARAQATIRATGGTGYATAVSGNVTAGQRTAIENYISTHVLGAVNTHEGL